MSDVFMKWAEVLVLLIACGSLLLGRVMGTIDVLGMGYLFLVAFSMMPDRARKDEEEND